MLSLFSYLDHFSLLRLLYITLTFLPHLHQPPSSFISLSTTSLALAHICIKRLLQFCSLLMESVAPKRPRPQEEEEEEVNSEESLKRQRPYSHILSLLESEEEESPQDLSPLITTLQEEITSSSSCSSSDETLLAPPPAENSQQVVVHPETSETPFTPPVMRHLLEASDDELGIPNSTTGWDFGDDYNMFSGGFMNNIDASEDINGFANSLCDGLWELEDETANYYTLLQSQLFI